MPLLFITEYSRITVDHGNLTVPVPITPGVEQVIEMELKPKLCEPFREQTRFIIVHTDADCALAFGKSPSASPNRHGLSAGETRAYGVASGDRLSAVLR